MSSRWRFCPSRSTHLVEVLESAAADGRTRAAVERHTVRQEYADEDGVDVGIFGFSRRRRLGDPIRDDLERPLRHPDQAHSIPELFEVLNAKLGRRVVETADVRSVLQGLGDGFEQVVERLAVAHVEDHLNREVPVVAVGKQVDMQALGLRGAKPSA